MMTNRKQTQIPEPQWQEVAAAIEAAESILLVSHFAPDGDAVGSLLGLAGALQAQGKNITSAIDGGAPPDLAFVPRSETILPALTRGKFDLMVALDSSDVGRVGVAGAYGLAHSQTVINIDHHPTNTCYGDIHLIVPSAVATTEIVFDLLNYLNLPLNLDIASALLTGLITDTHGFRISATKSRTLEIAQTLMLAGAPLARIMAQTLNRRPYAEVELWKRALPSAQLEGGVISAIITQADIKQAGLRRTGDGGLVTHLVNVAEAKVSVVFKELPGGKIEIGFRAKPGFDVASLAFQLGGGGHTLASGCTLAGSVEEVAARVLPLTQQVVAEGADA